MTIRPATIQDTPALVALLRVGGLDQPQIAYEEFTHPVLVAEHEGQVIGFVQALMGKPVTIMTDMVVDPAFAHQGVGRALLEAMERTLDALGLRYWGAIVREDNERVAQALTRYGAKETGTARMFARIIP